MSIIYSVCNICYLLIHKPLSVYFSKDYIWSGNNKWNKYNNKYLKASTILKCLFATYILSRYIIFLINLKSETSEISNSIHIYLFERFRFKICFKSPYMTIQNPTGWTRVKTIVFQIIEALSRSFSWKTFWSGRGSA